MSVLEIIAGYWIIVVIYSVASALVCAFIARSRRRDQGNWFVYGLFGGIVAVVLLALLARLPEPPNNNLLLDSDHHLRSGWRVLLFFIILMIVYYALGNLAKATHVVPSQSLFFIFYIAVALVTVFMLRIVDRKRFISVGFPYHGRMWKEILLGVVIGTLMIGVVAGVELLLGALKLSLRPGMEILLAMKNFGLSFVLFAFFAMGEELVFRGYPFQAFVQGIGPVLATILMSLAFGLLHLTNPDSGFFSTTNTILAGVLLSVAYLKTRTLYFPFAIHFSWNFVQSFVLSLPVSGLLTNRTIFVPTDFGPDWLTGGRYGPEAGIGTTVVMAIAIGYLLIEKRIKPDYDWVSLNSRIVKQGTRSNDR